jgi:hypothetical protein
MYYPIITILYSIGLHSPFQRKWYDLKEIRHKNFVWCEYTGFFRGWNAFR